MKNISSFIYSHIKENGGITFDLRNQEVVKEGFAVSIYKSNETKIPFNDFNESSIDAFVLNNYNLFTREDNTMLGAWVADGFVWLDITIVTNNKMEALDLARRNEQLAIFDLATFEEIKA